MSHRASDNEERSEAMFGEYAADVHVEPTTAARTSNMILLTKLHGPVATSTPDGADAALMLDMDMAVLGASEAEYDAYARAIAWEYRHVPPAAFGPARAAVLRTFLANPRIYGSDELHARFEHRARANIARELARLEAGQAA